MRITWGKVMIGVKEGIKEQEGKGAGECVLLKFVKFAEVSSGVL